MVGGFADELRYVSAVDSCGTELFDDGLAVLDDRYWRLCEWGYDGPGVSGVVCAVVEYGAFCPIFRAHGARKNNQNELWSFGPEAQKTLTLYDRLRYRLMPYIYTLGAKTTFDGYTPMWTLAFDFASDSKALDINDAVRVSMARAERYSELES